MFSHLKYFLYIYQTTIFVINLSRSQLFFAVPFEAVPDFFVDILGDTLYSRENPMGSAVVTISSWLHSQNESKFVGYEEDERN